MTRILTNALKTAKRLWTTGHIDDEALHEIEALCKGRPGVGARIIEALEEATRGEFARITIEGQTWVRQRTANKQAFEFYIVASGLDPSADDFEARFKGCDDATISFRDGYTVVDFTREAPTLAAAIKSAIDDVTAAGATVVQIRTVEDKQT